MSWVIVEIDTSVGGDVVVPGPFETEHEAEMIRRERYFDRQQDSPYNTARWFKSYVRELISR